MPVLPGLWQSAASPQFVELFLVDFLVAQTNVFRGLLSRACGPRIS